MKSSPRDLLGSQQTLTDRNLAASCPWSFRAFANVPTIITHTFVPYFWLRTLRY